MSLICTQCGARVPFTLHGGHSVNVTVEHETRCAFFQAVQAGRGGAWELKHGPAVVLTRSDAVGRN